MRMLRRLLPMTLTVVALSTAVRLPIGAQQRDLTRAGVTRDSTVLSAMRPAALTRRVQTEEPSRVVLVAHDVLVGAGVGAAVGLVTALVLVNRSNVTDHSEDELAFMALGVEGSLLGMIVGAIVGLVRSP